MSFELKKTKALDDQLARIVTREVRKAAEQAKEPPGEASIHETRQHIKKTRSVLRLLRKALGDDYAKLNDDLRSAAHRLSVARDADALIPLMESLSGRYHDVITPAAVRRANATLKADRREAYAKLTGRTLADVTDALERSRRRLRSSVQSVVTRRNLRRGITSGYRRARRAMADVSDVRADDALFHAWRRRIKDHWHQMRLLERISRRASARVRPLKQLEKWLGEDHNLVLLRTTILAHPRRFGDSQTVSATLGCIDKRMATLRSRALRRARRLFSGKAPAFKKDMRKAWVA
jgi:CHAD domain-containing protein